MEAILRSTTFQCTIMGTSVVVGISIKQTYETTLEFTLSGTAYTFSIARWSRRGLTPFLLLFFADTERNAEQFGTCEQSAEGFPAINMTTEQKLNAITQGAKDIMRCVDMIATKHQRSVLDYAVWYREKYSAWEPYDNYITMLACNSIVHTDFLAPGVSWEVVKFCYA